MRSGLTISLAEDIGAMSTDPLVILLLINIFLLVVGCFMEPVVAILILGSSADAGYHQGRHRSASFRRGHGP